MACPTTIPTGADRLSQTECEARMRGSSPGESKNEAWRDVIDSTTPVLHNWLLHTSVSPVQWYERQTRFARSLAVASAAGWAVGLVNRRPSNFLLADTAEVVHLELQQLFDAARAPPPYDIASEEVH